MSTAPVYTDETAAWSPEPDWSRVDFELLNEDEATAILLRRMRKLLARSSDSQELAGGPLQAGPSSQRTQR